MRLDGNALKELGTQNSLPDPDVMAVDILENLQSATEGFNERILFVRNLFSGGLKDNKYSLYFGVTSEEIKEMAVFFVSSCLSLSAVMTLLVRIPIMVWFCASAPSPTTGITSPPTGNLAREDTIFN